MGGSLRKAVVFAAFLLAGLLALNCGGENGQSSANVSAIPTLAGTPIPTAVIEPSPTPECGKAAEAEFPDNFPDVPIPDGYLLDLVESEPHLSVAGRVAPELVGTQNPVSAVALPLVLEFRDAGWEIEYQDPFDGLRYEFTAADGRNGMFHALPRFGCQGEMVLSYEFRWVTP